MEKKLVLASSSPYRKQLLQRLMIDFSCSSPELDEDGFKQRGLAPLELALELAKAKAEEVLKKYVNNSQTVIVIGSDQLLSCGSDILGKPGSKEKALEQLQFLSGKTHQLITAMAVVSNDKDAKMATHVDTTTLTMRNLGKAQLQRYVDQDNPINCAGSYMLESSGIILFEKIDSQDQTAIVGLPLIELTTILSGFGLYQDC